MSDAKTPEEHKKKLVRAKVNNAIRDGRMKNQLIVLFVINLAKNFSFIMNHITNLGNQKVNGFVLVAIRNLLLIINEKYQNKERLEWQNLIIMK